MDDLARRWAQGREMMRLLVKDEPGVMRFRQGRKQAHTMDSVPGSVARQLLLEWPGELEHQLQTLVAPDAAQLLGMHTLCGDGGQAAAP